jgi:hypothetical protein
LDDGEVGDEADGAEAGDEIGAEVEVGDVVVDDEDPEEALLGGLDECGGSGGRGGLEVGEVVLLCFWGHGLESLSAQQEEGWSKGQRKQRGTGACFGLSDGRGRGRGRGVGVYVNRDKGKKTRKRKKGKRERERERAEGKNIPNEHPFGQSVVAVTIWYEARMGEGEEGKTI